MIGLAGLSLFFWANFVSAGAQPPLPSGSGSGTGTGMESGATSNTTGTGRLSGGEGMTGTGFESGVRRFGYGYRRYNEGPALSEKELAEIDAKRGVERKILSPEDYEGLHRVMLQRALVMRDPGERSLALIRLARSQLLNQEFRTAGATLMDASTAALASDPSVKDLRINGIVLEFTALSRDVMSKAMPKSVANLGVRIGRRTVSGLDDFSGANPIPRAPGGTRTPAEEGVDRLDSARYALWCCEYAAWLAAQLRNPDYLSDQLFHIVDSAGRESEELMIELDRYNAEWDADVYRFNIPFDKRVSDARDEDFYKLSRTDQATDPRRDAEEEKARLRRTRAFIDAPEGKGLVREVKAALDAVADERADDRELEKRFDRLRKALDALQEGVAYANPRGRDEAADERPAEQRNAGERPDGEAWLSLIAPLRSKLDFKSTARALARNADRFLERGAVHASYIRIPQWRDQALISLVRNAAASDQFPRGLAIARTIPRSENLAESLIAIAEGQARSGFQDDASRTYIEAARAVASIPLDDPRSTLNGLLVDSLISVGRFEDARACTAFYPDEPGRVAALGAVAQSMGARGLADRAHAWIEKVPDPDLRAFLARRMLDGMSFKIRAEKELEDQRRPASE